MFEMDQDEGSPDEIADPAGAEGDVMERGPALGEQGVAGAVAGVEFVAGGLLERDMDTVACAVVSGVGQDRQRASGRHAAGSTWAQAAVMPTVWPGSASLVPRDVPMCPRACPPMPVHAPEIPAVPIGLAEKTSLVKWGMLRDGVLHRSELDWQSQWRLFSLSVWLTR